MSITQPVTTTLDARFSAEDATPAPWTEARRRLEAAEVYWLSTVRADGRPHVTPLIGVWRDGAGYFCTGPTEQKAKNLADNQHCILTTGCNTLGDDLDVVVEGEAVRITYDAELRLLAAAWEAKYGSDWHFDVRDGAFRHTAATPGEQGFEALVFEVAPTKVLGFRKNSGSGQTRWRFRRG